MNNIIISLIYLITSCLMLVLGRNLYLKLIKYDMQKEIQNELYNITKENGLIF